MPPLVNKPLVMIDVRNIFPGLSYKKVKNTFSNSVRNNDVGAQVEFLLNDPSQEPRKQLKSRLLDCRRGALRCLDKPLVV